MTKKPNSSSWSIKLYHYLLIVLLLVAVSIRGGRDFSKLFSKEQEINYDLHDIQKAFPTAYGFFKQDDGSVLVEDGHRDIIGRALLTTKFTDKSFGYGGKVPVLLAVDKTGKIKGSYLLENSESEEFLEYIYESELLQKWNSLTLEEAAEAKVDGVSGATETADAIRHGVQQTAALYVGAQAKPLIDFMKIAHSVLFVLLVVVALLMTYKSGLKKWRWVYLIAVLAIMGLLTKKMLSLEMLNGWLVNGFPWRTNWESIVLLALAVFMPMLSKPKFYCNYLCPMGAAQELVGKISPVKKKNLNIRFAKVKIREVYLSLIWMAVLLGFLPSLAKFEPFLFFSLRVSGYFFIVFGAVMLVASFFYNRPWCSLCPTGCLLDTLAPVKNKNS